MPHSQLGYDLQLSTTSLCFCRFKGCTYCREGDGISYNEHTGAGHQGHTVPIRSVFFTFLVSLGELTKTK